ncbi:P-loop NTPase fold protein, partial [Herbaspirillum rhizosphaerae]
MITRAISNEIQAEGHDAPILRPEEDLLNGIGVARAINQFIQTSPKGWSTRIGLYGPWGSGKTSILNLLKTIEEKQHSVVLSFSAWSAVEESDVISLFYEKLRECLIKEDIHLSLKHTYKHLARKVNPIRKLFNLLKSGLAALAELLPVPSLVAKLAIESTADIASFAVSWSKFDHKDLDDLVTQLAGRRVVVFIDDLDRADPKVVPKTLLALRELLDWPGFTFVLAFDKKIIARALSDYSPSFGDDAQGFLEKIIDIPFDLPPPKKQHKNLLISAALHACCKCISQATLETLTDVFPNQPRRIKLIARSIGALGPSLDRHSEEEIDWRSVYLHAIAWEENPKIIDWIISALSKEREDWSSWAINEDERNVHKEKIRKSLEPFLSNSLDSADIQRIFNVTHLLLTHWQNISDETIQYWAQLGSSPPSFTAREARDIQSRYLSDKNNEQVVVRIHQAALIADCSTEEAALDLAKFAIMEYETSLDSMADARTSIEWENRLKKATGNLTFLEYFLNECDDQFVRN